MGFAYAATETGSAACFVSDRLRPNEALGAGMTINPKVLYADLDDLGEEAVRDNVANRIYGGDTQALVAQRLKRKDATVSAAETNTLVRDAIQHAKVANRIAIAAAVVTVTAMIVSVFD
jgi:hypothetical protein